MKNVTLIAWLFVMLIMTLANTGCSSRSETSVVLADSTIVYPSRDSNGMQAKITLYRTQSKKTGKRIGESTVFTIRKKANVKAIIELENLKNTGRLNMFHIDWVDPDGNSFYMKRMDIKPDDTTSALKSSISIEPDKREPGEYIFRVFYFRELIAEKKFRLRKEVPVSAADGKKVSARVILCKSVDKITGERIGVDSVFIITKKAKVRAVVELGNLDRFGDRSLQFRFDWTDKDGTVVMTKPLNLAPGDATDTLTNSLPATPGLRKPGTYFMHLYLFGFPLTEMKFELKPEPGIILAKVDGITANITLCKKVDKKTGERIGEGIEFNIDEKAKVLALVDIENSNLSNDKEMKFRIEWFGTNGKAFYDKEEIFSPDDASFTMNSSISITPEKRKPGKYTVRIFLEKKMIADKKFILK